MADDKGWFSVHRKLLCDEFWLSEKFTRPQAWVDLLGLANHKDGWYRCRGIRVDVKRGQVGHSEKTLAKRWKWSRTKVRAFLGELEKEQQIRHQKTNVTTLITIVNYHHYQEKKTAKRTPEEHQKDTNNNVNNENNKIPHTQGETKKLSTGLKISPMTYITEDFYPDPQTVEYCRARNLPDPTNQQALDDFINGNLSKNWTSGNWQAEYRKFLPKWRMISERIKNSGGRNRAERMLDAIRNLPDN